MNKLRILLLALAYACFWSLFVLFPYPANVLPESHASYVAGPVFASNLITLVGWPAARRPSSGPAPCCSPARPRSLPAPMPERSRAG